MEIILVGTGNVARVLGHKLRAAGNRILQVYGRNLAAARDLASSLGAAATDQPAAISRSADLVIFAVSDDAIAPLASILAFPNSLVVHTAGSVPAGVLAKSSPRYGVFYPLQSLRPQFPDEGIIPFLLQASAEEDLQQLASLVAAMGAQWQSATDESRLNMHLAAVWVNNFPNLLFSIAYDWCREHRLDFHLLQPLMLETVTRLKGEDPAQWQTGPAIRHDEATMNRHLQLMQAHPEWQQLYRAISALIQSHNHSRG